MSGNRAGGLKAAETNKLKYGPGFYSEIGRRGGENGTGHAFGHGKVDPSAAGKVGGQRSKRRSSKFTAVQSGEQDRPTAQEESIEAQTLVENSFGVKEQKTGFFSSVLRAFGE